MQNRKSENNYIWGKNTLKIKSNIEDVGQIQQQPQQILLNYAIIKIFRLKYTIKVQL